MLAEMHTGHPLFNGGNEHDQICKIHELLGVPPVSMLQKSSQDKVNRFFTHTVDGFVLNPSKHYRSRGRSLDDVVTTTCHEELPNERTDFLDLIRKLLTYDPDKRISPTDALKHPFCRIHVGANTPTAALRRSARLRANSTNSRSPSFDDPTTKGDLEQQLRQAQPFSSPDFTRLHIS